MHLVGKETTKGKLRRRWDRARTPYQRLLASGILASDQKARLAGLYVNTNPRQLREEIYQGVEHPWKAPITQPITQKEEAPVLR